MRRTHARSLLVALFAGLVVGATGTVASAVVVASDWRNVIVIDGVQHSNRSATENPPKRGVATARAASSVGAGRLGAAAFVANSGGAVCASVGTSYSTFATASFSTYTSSGSCSGNVRTFGTSYHYQPSSGTYFSYSTYTSPYQAW